jgi:hypothetical protein
MAGNQQFPPEARPLGKQGGIAQPDEHPLGHFRLVAPFDLIHAPIARCIFCSRSRRDYLIPAKTTQIRTRRINPAQSAQRIFHLIETVLPHAEPRRYNRNSRLFLEVGGRNAGDIRHNLVPLVLAYAPPTSSRDQLADPLPLTGERHAGTTQRRLRGATAIPRNCVRPSHRPWLRNKGTASVPAREQPGSS